MNPDSRKIRMLLDLRGGGVTDRRVLSAMERTPREIFVPEQFRDKAYDNLALPIGHQQTVSQLLVVGQMTQALDVGDRMKVLEIGTGSGYQASVLALLCRRLYSIERHRELLDQAEKRFSELRLTNITSLAGDGSRGWPEQAPFDRIIVTAAAPEVPAALLDQLGPGGILIAPIGRPGAMQNLVRLTRHDTGFSEESLGQVRFVPLVEGDVSSGRARKTAIEAVVDAQRTAP